MSGHARNAVSFTLRDDGRDFIAVISTPAGINPPDITPEMLARIVSPATNLWGAIPLSLLNGSSLTLELRPHKNSGKGKTKSAKGRKAKKKKSRSTGKRKRNTSKGAGTKGANST
jgi:hypothetical protein